MTENCSNCKHWLPKVKGGIEGRCRRYPPVYINLETSRFPFTGHDCWCGEWRGVVENVARRAAKAAATREVNPPWLAERTLGQFVDEKTRFKPVMMKAIEDRYDTSIDRAHCRSWLLDCVTIAERYYRGTLDDDS